MLWSGTPVHQSQSSGISQLRTWESPSYHIKCAWSCFLIKIKLDKPIIGLSKVQTDKWTFVGYLMFSYQFTYSVLCTEYIESIGAALAWILFSSHYHSIHPVQCLFCILKSMKASCTLHKGWNVLFCVLEPLSYRNIGLVLHDIRVISPLALVDMLLIRLGNWKDQSPARWNDSVACIGSKSYLCTSVYHDERLCITIPSSKTWSFYGSCKPYKFILYSYISLLINEGELDCWMSAWLFISQHLLRQIICSRSHLFGTIRFCQ